MLTKITHTSSRGFLLLIYKEYIRSCYLRAVTFSLLNVPYTFFYYTLYDTSCIHQLLFRQTTPGTPVEQCHGTSDPSRYLASKMSRMLGSARMFWLSSGIMLSAASLLGCSPCPCVDDVVVSKVSSSACVTSSYSSGSLMSLGAARVRGV